MTIFSMKLKAINFILSTVDLVQDVLNLIYIIYKIEDFSYARKTPVKTPESSVANVNP